MEDLDRILVSEEPLAPSSGFAARVMQAVEEAQAALPPLPFPWGSFALGVAACLLGAASGVWLFAALDLSPARDVLVEAWPQAGYAAAVVLGTLAMLHGPRLRIAVERLARAMDLARSTPRM
jgi:hypothetical protein